MDASKIHRNNIKDSFLSSLTSIIAHLYTRVKFKRRIISFAVTQLSDSYKTSAKL